MSGMMLRQFLLVLFLVFYVVHIAYAESVPQCLTPNGSHGRCVPFTACEYAVQVQRNYANEIPEIWQNFFAKSTCASNTNEQRHICCDRAYIMAEAATNDVPTTEIIFASPHENFEAKLNANAVALLRNVSCDRVEISTRIIAFGNVTDIGEFRWVALLRYDNPHKPFHCGGSLISERYVITAAHCIIDTRDALIGIRLGEHDFAQEEDCDYSGNCYKPVDYEIEKIIPHPEYNRNQHINDIGLLRTKSVVEFKDHIAPICLPLTNEVAQVTEYPRKYIIAGWGTTETNQQSHIMLKAHMLPETRSYCQNIFRQTHIADGHICARGENRADSCKGDSGGPLFAYTQATNSYVLYGVIAAGVAKCGDETAYPSVYANVVQFMPWITNNLIA